jgi:Ca2+-transporting ATPase
MAFLVLSLTQVVHSFNMRSSRSLFKIGPFTNRTLTLAAVVSFAMIALVSFVPPLATIFGLTTLSYGLYLVAALLAFVPLPVLEATKMIGLVRHRK